MVAINDSGRGVPAAIEWGRFAAEHWQRSPALLPLPAAPLSADEAFALIDAVVRPFRTGLRFFALPALRFRVGDTEIRAPGDLLPDREAPDRVDATIAGYLQRLGARGGDDPAWLEIDQPLMADVAAWSAVRDFLQDLWRHTGVPVQSILAQLALGRYQHEADCSATVFLLPLYGDVDVAIEEVGKPAAPCAWTASAGDLVYVPGGWRLRECCASGALVLRLTLPQAEETLVREVRELAIAMMQPVLHPDGATPMVPVDGTVGPQDPLDALVRALPECVRGRDFETALQVTWAARRSACALEPAPARAVHAPLQADDRIHLALGTRIVSLPMTGGVAVWAVNGHVFAMREGAAGESLRRRLNETNEPVRVGDVCRSADGASDTGLVELLDRVHAAHGLVRMSPDTRADARAPAPVDAAG